MNTELNTFDFEARKHSYHVKLLQEDPSNPRNFSEYDEPKVTPVVQNNHIDKNMHNTLVVDTTVREDLSYDINRVTPTNNYHMETDIFDFETHKHYRHAELLSEDEQSYLEEPTVQGNTVQLTHTTPGAVPKHRHDSGLDIDIEAFHEESRDLLEYGKTPPSHEGIDLSLQDPTRYPTHNLPWHFSFVDPEMMVAAMSIPCERAHWKAMKDLGIRLVVNLTEQPVTPQSFERKPRVCPNCRMLDEVYFPDLFDDMSSDGEGTGDDMDVLQLPINDGSVPKFTQIDLFLDIVDEYISQGKKVAIHCQAGVGRTGLFVAIYLLHRSIRSGENTAPLEIIQRLRRVRPQSMQFRVSDWQSIPFLWTEDNGDHTVWQRNFLQERFVEYWCAMKGYKIRPHGVDVKPPVLANISCSEPGESDEEEDRDEMELADDRVMLPSYLNIDEELMVLVDVELSSRLRKQRVSDEILIPEPKLRRLGTCYSCKLVNAIGPYPVKRRYTWPDYLPVYDPTSPSSRRPSMNMELLSNMRATAPSSATTEED